MRNWIRHLIPRTSLEWALLWSRVKYWSWQLATKVVIGTIYLSVIAEGFRVLIPVLGRKLHRIPLLGRLDDYESTYQLDMAICLACFMLIAVWSLWDQILGLWLHDRIGFDGRLWRQGNRVTFIVVMGSAILASDGVLFFVAVTRVSWGRNGFSLTALFATVAYVSVLVYSIYMAISLRESISDNLKELNDVSQQPADVDGDDVSYPPYDDDWLREAS